MILQVGVKALIQNGSGQYLFLRRSQAMDGESEPSWDIPGGRIQPDEALDVALAREILEETGLIITERPKLIAAQDIFVQQKDLHVVRLTYTVACSATDVQLSDEHSDCQWLAASDTRSLHMEPYLRQAISDLA